MGEKERIRHKERWESDPDYVLSIKENRSRSYWKVKRFLADYKLEQGCVDCGYSDHHAALEFDHVRGDKQFSLSNAKTIALAIEEMKKCEVVCSNCHAIRTFNRRRENERG